MNDSVQSGADYAAILISVLEKSEKELPEQEKLPIQLFDLWITEIEEYADKTWEEYIIGKREDFCFCEDEMKQLYDNAMGKFVALTLDSLVDKDLVDVSVNDNGEFLYGLTDKGRMVVENDLKDDKN